MESERPIEKILREAAKRRLPTPPFELHPATKRLLSGEVRRFFAKPGAAPEARHGFSFFLSRLGWVFAVFAGVAMAAFLMLPREPQPSLGTTMAKNEVKTARDLTDRTPARRVLDRKSTRLN